MSILREINIGDKILFPEMDGSNFNFFSQKEAYFKGWSDRLDGAYLVLVCGGSTRHDCVVNVDENSFTGATIIEKAPFIKITKTGRRIRRIY